MPDTRKGSIKSNGDDPMSVMNETLRIGLANIENKFTLLKEELKEEIIASIRKTVLETIKKEISTLHDRISNQEEELNQLKKIIIKNEEVKLYKERKGISCNLVLRGVNEDEHETDSEVEEKINKLFNNQVMLIRASRVGRINQQRPRTIKFTVDSIDSRNELLTRFRTQRHIFPRGVFLDPDRTFLDRKEAFRLRQKKKQLQLIHPTKSIVIRRGCLLIDGAEVDREQPLKHLFPSD